MAYHHDLAAGATGGRWAAMVTAGRRHLLRVAVVDGPAGTHEIDDPQRVLNLPC